MPAPQRYFDSCLRRRVLLIHLQSCRYKHSLLPEHREQLKIVLRRQNHPSLTAEVRATATASAWARQVTRAQIRRELFSGAVGGAGQQQVAGGPVPMLI
jgi:hypothetical protein